MKHVPRLLASLLVLTCFQTNAPAANPLRLHPVNPHYFEFQGKPTVLITAGEHYGAVLNLDFKPEIYLDELARHGFNLTRIFSGTYREVPGSFNITGNTLAPAAGRFVCPWARSSTPGATDGGNKFDLTKFDEKYFGRLKKFIQAAGKRGVVVELVLFCTMYDDKVWEASPMHGRNNINGIGGVGKYEVYSGKEQELSRVQERVTQKLVSELNTFDNVYFEICNEPYERGGLTREWNDRIVASIVEAEAGLPKKHLIAQGFPPTSSPIKVLNPRVSVLNFHAAKPEAVRLNYGLKRVIAFDETGGSDRTDRKYRTEGWEWIMAGGGVYDHLDFSFTTERPDGGAVPLPPGTPGGGGPEIRNQLRILKEFIHSLPFVRMSPGDDVLKDSRITGAENSKPSVRVLVEEGRTYAAYVNGGTQSELVLDLPRGDYQCEWINTRSGWIEKSESIQHAGELRTIKSPGYSEDIVLRVVRQSARSKE